MQHSDLKRMTGQEVFNMSANHLLKQNEMCSTDDDGCLYRDDNGNKCAAGVFLSDDEGYRFNVGLGWINVAQSLGQTEHDALICDLQNIHDDNHVDIWPELLKNLAEKVGLTMVDIPSE